MTKELNLDCRLADLPFPPIVVKFHTLTSNTLNLYDLLVFIIHTKASFAWPGPALKCYQPVEREREKEERESVIHVLYQTNFTFLYGL